MMNRSITLLFTVLVVIISVLSLLSNSTAATNQKMMTASSSEEEWPKYYHTTSGKYLSMAQVMNFVTAHPIVFVGEYHDHVWGHKIEYMLLKQLYTNLTQQSTTKKLKFGVSLEMFERDVQAWVSGYVDGQVSEQCFLQNSRPWPNHNTDYKPLVDFVRDQVVSSKGENGKQQQQKQQKARPIHSTSVLAANIPRRYAAFVSSGNEDAIFAMPAVEKSFMAPEILAPHDQYYQNFYDLMKPSGWDDEKIERYYRAQCIKDDTMAMSIAQFFEEQQKDNTIDTRVISYSGSFHVDYHLGLVSKVNQLLPSVPSILLSMVPVDPLEPIKPEQYKDLADIVVFAPENPQ